MAEADGAPTLRRRVFELLDVSSSEPVGRAIDLGLIALIVVNVAAAVADSVPSLAERFGAAFRILEVVSVGLFSLEYLVRLWCAPEGAQTARLPAWRSRLHYAATPAALIDLVSIAPVYAALVTEIDVRAFLVLRLLRFFKLARYSPGLESLLSALASERRALSACLVILFGLVLVAATAMHVAEADAQPERLGTIPDAMYWAFITLTTVGYGDVVPVTPLGKMIASLTAVVGIGMLALPVGILASAFADEIRRRDFVVTATMVAKVPLFAEIDIGDLGGIMRVLHARTVEAGEVVVQKGEPSHAMFFIAGGMAEVELPDRRIRLKPGDFFGEIGLLQGRARTATVIAATQARLLVLHAKDLQHLLDHSPKMAARVRAVAEERAHGVAPSS